MKELKRKFDFVGVGTKKAGSSAMWKFILEHPQVYSDHSEYGFSKEPNYFNTMDRNNLPPKFDTLYDYWNDAPPDQLLGEFTITYIESPSALWEIKHHNPKVKIIAILRNPVDRFYSEFNMHNNIRMEWRDNSVEDFLVGDQWQNHPHITKSLYADKIETIYEIFDKRYVHFVKYEEFLNNPQETMNKVFYFLGVDPSAYTHVDKKVHSIPYIEPIKEQSRKTLVEFFQKDIKRTESLLNWDCSDWKLW